MASAPFPSVPKALLERLQEYFPDRLPGVEPLQSHVELARLVGRQDVIRKLAHEYKRQTEGV